MKKTNFENQADVYKYFIRLRPSAKELDIRPFVQPVVSINPRNEQFAPLNK